MQRLLMSADSAYARRRRALRARKSISPQPSQPATTAPTWLYPLRVRNTPERRAVWAAYIQALRQASRISRPELARRLGVDPTTVWRWETSRQKPESPDIPQAIARLFDQDVDQVLAAAGLIPDADPAPVAEVDPEEEYVLKHPRLSDARKVQIIKLIRARRAREREAGMEDTRRLVELIEREAS